MGADKQGVTEEDMIEMWRCAQGEPELAAWTKSAKKKARHMTLGELYMALAARVLEQRECELKA